VYKFQKRFRGHIDSIKAFATNQSAMFTSIRAFYGDCVLSDAIYAAQQRNDAITMYYLLWVDKQLVGKGITFCLK
jgi:hypothetical protein